MSCPICDQAAPADTMSLFDDRYGYPEPVRLALCEHCGHRYALPKMSEAVLGSIYTQYYQRENVDPYSVVAHREPSRFWGWLSGDLSSAARWVPPGVKVLDIGCGLGTYVAYHASRGCEAHGIDADANVKIVAEKLGLNIRVGLFKSDDYPKNYFDAVTMDQVIEHVLDPVTTLRDIWIVLKPGGRLIMSTPNANGWGRRLFGRRWLNWHAPYHQQLLSRKSIMLLAERTGFELERSTTVTRSAWLTFQLAHLLTYPAPGHPSAFWAPKSVAPSIVQKISVKLCIATKLTLFPQLITRFFDSVQNGDNHLIVMRKTT